MSEVNERRDRLQVVLEAAAQALHGLGDEEREAAAGGAELLERVVAYTQIVVGQTDPELITDDALNAIETGANLIALNPAAAIESAREYADDLLRPVAVLPFARDRQVEQSVKDAVANFQRSATRRLNALEADVETKRTAIEDELARLRATVEETSSQTMALIASQAEAFDAKLTEFETTLTNQRQAISEALERQSSAFSATQEERSATFQSEIAKAQEDLTAMVESAREEVDARVEVMRRMEEESSGLVHSIGLGGTAERYGEERTEQKTVADRFRLLTVLLALGAVAMAIFAVLHEAEETSAVLAKLGVSLVLGALATYTARQSGRHRRREERARNLQLELTAFAPFIEPLSDDSKEFERVLMTRKTFGNIAALPDTDDDHRYGPLGPVLERIQKRLDARAEAPD